jgi:hypothetical protein
MRAFRFLAAAVSLGLAFPGPARAEQETSAAKGRFQSKDVTFNVADAYAFRSKTEFGDGQVLTVAISNYGILEGSIDRWLDRKQVFEKRFKDDKAVVVYFEFSPEGRYRGASYYFGSGNGCGYCSSSDVKSDVKLAGGQLTGSFSSRKDPSWDITLAVPVARDDYGAALPAGGGDPGKVYLAFAAAVKGRDPAALKTLMVARRVAGMAQAEKAGQMQDFLSFVNEGRYVDSVRVVKGFATAERAILAIAGEGPVGKRSGQVLLIKEPGGWRVDDEILDMATGQ